MNWTGVNFAGNDTINITLQGCQQNIGSSLKASVNDGAFVAFDSNCFIQDYNATGNLNSANVTIQFLAGNLTNPFYTPLVIGNLSLDSRPVFPTISYNAQTPADNSTINSNSIYVNVSVSDTNFENMTYYLYNETLNVSKLVGYWNFDRNTTLVRDISGNKNSGTRNGGVNWTTGGKLDSGFSFDGVNDFINIDTAVGYLATTTTGTWSVWVKPVDATPAANDWLISFSNTTGLTTITSGISTTGLLWVIAQTAGVVKWDIDTNAAAFSDNTWTHITLVQDGTSPVLYVNGVAVAQAFTTTTDKTWWFNNDATLNNGRLADINFNNGVESNFFNGNMDEVMIFNTALSATDVSELYNRNLVNHTTYSTKTEFINWTSLADNDYNYFVDVIDDAENYNSTLLRSIELDTTFPTIVFASPTTNASNLSQSFIQANLSFSDTNLGTANISLFNSTQNIINSSFGTASPLFINFTGLADGRYYLNATVNDSANNKNYTETRTVNVNINLTAGIWKDLSTKDTGSWAGVDGVVSVAVNPNNNLVYTGLGSGKFGVYNHSNGIWMNLSGNDTGDWVGTAVVNGVAVNTNDNLVYTGLGSDKFGVYNHSNGIWMNLSGNDTGDWVGTDTINAVAVNTNNNLVYTGLTSGKFGVYNHSNGIWMNLSGNDTNNWVGIDDAIKGVAVNTNNNLVYTSLVLGKFGAYNHSNGVWMDLSGNDTGDWVGLDYVYGVAVNTNNNLVYTGLQSGKFGVYNHSNGVWMGLSGNDSASGTGNWAETEIVYGISVNPNDNLVYTVLASGKFGAYNHSGSRAETSGPSDTSGGGDTPIDLLSGFNVAPQKMSVALKPNESKTECFTVANTGTTTVNANLNVLGEIITFVSLTDSVLQVPTGNSKSSCAIFSAGLLDIPKNYSGKIEVKGKSTKYIDVNLEIVNLTAINITAPGVLPVGILGFLPGDPVRVLPVGILGFLPSDPIRVLPVGIEGLLPRDRPPEIAETLVKGAIFISLWILLLLLLVIYLAVRKFIKLQNQLQGYKSREEKYEAERLKRN